MSEPFMLIHMVDVVVIPLDGETPEECVEAAKRYLIDMLPEEQLDERVLVQHDLPEWIEDGELYVTLAFKWENE